MGELGDLKPFDARPTAQQRSEGRYDFNFDLSLLAQVLFLDHCVKAAWLDEGDAKLCVVLLITSRTPPSLGAKARLRLARVNGHAHFG